MWQRQLPDSVRAALAAARRHEHPCCRALVYRDHLCDRRMRRTAHTEPHAKKKLDAELAGDKKVPPPPHFSRRARSFRHVISRARGAREARRGRSSHARARILPKKLSCSQARREQGAEEARALRARDPAPSARARRARQDPVPNFHVDTAHTGALAQARPLILTRALSGAIGPTQKTQSALRNESNQKKVRPVLNFLNGSSPLTESLTSRLVVTLRW